MQSIRIEFSLHAKNRMALYDISDPTVEAIIAVLEEEENGNNLR
jgi:hypothetical protein